MRGREISRIPGQSVSDRLETGAAANPIMNRLRGVFTHALSVNIWMDAEGALLASTLDLEMEMLARVLVRNGSCDDLGDGVFQINWAVVDYVPPTTRAAQKSFDLAEAQMRTQLNPKRGPRG